MPELVKQLKIEFIEQPDKLFTVRMKLNKHATQCIPNQTDEQLKVMAGIYGAVYEEAKKINASHKR